LKTTFLVKVPVYLIVSTLHIVKIGLEVIVTNQLAANACLMTTIAIWPCRLSLVNGCEREPERWGGPKSSRERSRIAVKISVVGRCVNVFSLFMICRLTINYKSTLFSSIFSLVYIPSSYLLSFVD
jgi:hypothetical protein